MKQKAAWENLLSGHFLSLPEEGLCQHRPLENIFMLCYFTPLQIPPLEHFVKLRFPTEKGFSSKQCRDRATFVGWVGIDPLKYLHWTAPFAKCRPIWIIQLAPLQKKSLYRTTLLRGLPVRMVLFSRPLCKRPVCHLDNICNCQYCQCYLSWKESHSGIVMLTLMAKE